MIYDNMEFFNVRELTQISNLPGLRVNRFEKSIINSFDFSSPASFSRGCEIRFMKKDNEKTTVYLYAADEDGEVLIFYGEYMFERHILPKGIITPVNIVKPLLLNSNFEELNKDVRFDTNVCRIFFNNKAIIHYCGIDTFGNNINPPNNMPKLTWLAYGSSITHGAGALSNYQSYIQLTARMLNSQVYNFGMSGCCMCELAIADYISKQTSIDFVLLEIGVNMRGKYSKEEYLKRVDYLLDKVAKTHKKVFVITIFPNIASYLYQNAISDNEVEFNNILKDTIYKKGYDNVSLFEGNEILTNFSTLTHDLIHPSDTGHSQMAQNLYFKISNLL